MSRFVISRIAQSIPVLIGITLLVFLAFELVPGDPAVLMMGEYATEAEVERLRHQLGLDRPLPERYVRFLARAVTGDFGRSYRTTFSVGEEIMPRLRATIELAAVSMVVSVAIGIPAGVLAGVRIGSWTDALVSTLVVVGFAIPSFWLGILLIILLSLQAGALPSAGYGTSQHLVLPTTTLAVGSIAIIARMTKSMMVEALSEDYVRTARSKGLPPRRVIWRHAFANAAIPVITIVGLRFGAMLGGSVIVESIFGWPGLGRMTVEAALTRDIPVVVAGSLVLATVFLATNLLVDLAYAWVDPRIRYA